MALTVAPAFSDGPLPAAKLTQLSTAINERTPLLVTKTADETVTASAAYQADNELVLQGAVNATYKAHLHVIVNSVVAADIKIRITLPSGGTAVQWTLSKASGPFIVAVMTTGLGVATTGADEPFDYIGLIKMGSTAGSIQVDWAQNASDPGATTVKAQSFFELVQVS